MWKNIAFRNYYLVAIIINILVVVALAIIKDYLPPLVPLFYGLPVSEAELTNKIGLFIAPGISLLITLLNFLISFWVKDDFQKKILAISTIVVSLLTAITVFKIVFLVGFF